MVAFLQGAGGLIKFCSQALRLTLWITICGEEELRLEKERPVDRSCVRSVIFFV